MITRVLTAAALLIMAAPVAAEPAPSVLSLGGAVTETVFAIGAGDSLVGSDQTSLYPPAAKLLPKVGYVRALGAEGILSLSPKIVLASADAGPPAALARVADAGVTVLTLREAHTPEAALARVRDIGAALGRVAQAEAMQSALAAERVQIARAAAQLWRRDGRAEGLGLFLDEPGASLDMAQQGLALRFARDCAANGAAVLAVLHDPNHAIGADQVALLCNGVLLDFGPTATVLTRAKLEKCLGLPLQVASKEDGSVAFVS